MAALDRAGGLRAPGLVGAGFDFESAGGEHFCRVGWRAGGVRAKGENAGAAGRHGVPDVEAWAKVREADAGMVWRETVRGEVAWWRRMRGLRWVVARASDIGVVLIRMLARWRLLCRVHWVIRQGWRLVAIGRPEGHVNLPSVPGREFTGGRPESQNTDVSRIARCGNGVNSLTHARKRIVRAEISPDLSDPPVVGQNL